MPQLKEHLLSRVAAKRDHFFIDLYDKAEDIVKQNGDIEYRAHGKKVVYGVAEVTDQLEILLSQELKNEFSAPYFKQKGTAEMLKLAKEWMPETTDSEEISKLAAVQQVLMSHTLNPKFAIIALTNWQIDKTAEYCDDYKLHLEQQICKDATVTLDQYLEQDPALVTDKDLQLALRKYHAVDDMAKKLQDKDTNGEMLPAEKRLSNFKHSFFENKEVLLEGEDTFGEKLCKSISALLTKGFAAALAIWKNADRQLTDKIENISSLNNP